MVSCHLAGLMFLPMTPLIMGSLATDFQATPTWLGTVASVQLVGTAVGAFLFSGLASHINARKLVIGAIGCELIVNLASAQADSLVELTLLRGMSGLAQGILLAAASATAVLAKKTSKIFVFYNVALAVLAVISIFIGSYIIPLFRFGAGFLLFFALDFGALLLILNGFPHFILPPRLRSGNYPSSPLSGVKIKAFLALAFFGVAIAGTQTFIERIGSWRGVEFETVAIFLALGWCLAVATPLLLVPLFKTKENYLVPLLVGYTSIVIVALTLSLVQPVSIYLLAAAIFIPLVMFLEPIQFGILGRLDETGRLAGLGPAAISIGAGVGPFLTSLSVKFFGLVSVGICASLMICVSLVFIYPLLIKANNNSDN
jgi:predicted MFS family arabinose efflux permease